MAQKATHRQTDSSSPVPVVLFGIDENGKPKAARFTDKHANLATKAAGHLKLHVLPIVGPVVVDLAGRVPAGRIHANGRGFVPYIRRDLYAKLVAAAGSPPQGDHASTQAAAVGGSTNPSSPNGQKHPPKNWDEIAPGHVVIALDEPGEGWYETVVLETSGDMLTLRWRDYPRDDIDINCLVLAKEDGPWRSWWEAIPTDKSDHMFLLRWRDFPQVPSITRPRWALGLLYPNGR